MTLARRRPIVMLVTNRARLAERVGAAPNDLESVTPHLLSQIESAAAAGVTVIQLREPDLEARALARLTRAAMRVIEGTEASLVVNGRVDVALAAGAHGVHLPERGLPSDRVRALLPQPALVGASIHAPVPGTGRQIAGLCGVWHDLRDEVEGAGTGVGGTGRLEACRRRIGNSGPGDWRCHAGADR